MTVNKKVDEKELENVAGGAVNGKDNNYACVSCGHKTSIMNFNPVHSEEGCDHYTTYTCPKCGHVWTKQV